ncbi:bifunctional phosphopantothenoylcysteine decarboxylase/phosphopantothenate--cysteine ligase CoaBC [Catalinimonas niigatensis]|uniref:bifunctional phosphopantothenoylcysteine decarboxylase/phosphopantothenate--cysteine ligase CoaBC n=1 Tax=Catalinimonas niigatensis TaxID=1397264 RepID=UPI0026663C6C|nr:bifunctional phosphopantothenoylcysteine decarboxylase/phosphopantothenate--cysteine ligase CoaBC [Catalinimonas niigatensis]WPP52478.1 bifunctional phosphopantothenoylcysteine decarboxylase/phosphopantothenate--cysteine ligase CoaBC [Catalinimonas niigatensis]
MLKSKKIIIGICGSIAAYKAAFLVRLLVKEGAEVRVIMTSSAKQFITPLTLATLSKNEVLSEFTANAEQGVWNNHVALGLWADLILVAPASAHTLARFSQGICNDLLTAVYLSARCPIMLAPAMDLDMYLHPSTQANLQKLRDYGNIIIDAASGELASGLSGVGRMAEPEDILQKLKHYFLPDLPLKQKRVLLTAGPTQEAIDPVRFISNASSGKMGYALAHTLTEYGATVYLISGPTHLTMENDKVTLISVRSAQEMFEAAEQYFETCDIAIFAAAVSDYTPVKKHTKKIKKSTEDLHLELSKTPDIAKSLSTRKGKHQFTVGFALETHDEEKNANKKIREKNLDMIVLNSLNDQGAGFGYDTNKVKVILAHSAEIKTFPLKSKQEVAKDIVQLIIDNYHA